MERFNTGIYQITNKISNKKYIGSALFLNKRKNQHFSSLKNNEHHNYPLQNSYNKNGKENFEFQILLYCDKKNLLFYEQRAIDAYGLKNLYNIRIKADSNYGRVFSEESKLKMSNSHKGIKLSKEHKENMSKAIKGKTVSKETCIKISIARTGMKFSKEHISKMKKIKGEKHKSSKPIYQINKNNNEVIKKWANAPEAGKYLNIFPNCICCCCNNKKGYLSAGGYKWRYVNE